jgi:hypothetical protein
VLRAALHDAALDLDGHALVNLRFEFADAARRHHLARRHPLSHAVTEPA